MIRTASDCMKKKPVWAALTIQQPDIKLKTAPGIPGAHPTQPNVK